MRHKIAITTTTFGQYDKEPLQLLGQHGHEVAMNPYGRKMNCEEIVAMCKDADGMIAGTEILDEDVLDNLPKLKVISRCGTGMDNVNIDAASRRGVKVYNTPNAPTEAVAELAIGLILNLLRRVTIMDKGIRNGKWNKRMGNLLSEMNVGIIGCGRIGSRVMEMLVPFGCNVAYSDVCQINNDGRYECMSFSDILRWADIITLHASGKNMLVGKDEMARMKQGSWLVNVSRGELVDEDALFDALGSGHLAGAAIDVFRNEPYDGKLKSLDNVILTPHIGSYAFESRIRMEIESVNNLISGLGG